MSGKTIVGWDNQVNYASLIAGSAAPNMAADNLQGDICDPSVAWQTAAGVVTAGAGAWFKGSPPAPRTYRLFGLARTNLTAAATVQFALYNNPASLVFSGFGSAIVPGYGITVLDAGQDHVADYFRIDVVDAANPDGFINVPGAYAGPAWVPATGMGWTSAFARDRTVDELRSLGGQEYPRFRYAPRRWDITLSDIVGSEMHADAMELDRVSALGGNCLLVPDRTSARVGQQAIFGRVASLADATFQAKAADMFAWRFRATERL